MINIIRSQSDVKLLKSILAARGAPNAPDVVDYSGSIVIKPWGYEFQVYDDRNNCSVWCACLKPGQAVSLHCHQRKSVVFIPLSNGLEFVILNDRMKMNDYISIEPGVFHSQENNTSEDGFFLECETPSEKTDLIRYRDRYGREKKGYEGKNAMMPMQDAFKQLRVPSLIQFLMQKVA